MANRPFNAIGFLQRWAAALVLVLVTYNPTGYSFLHWVRGPWEESLPLKVLAGIVLAILYIIFMRATWRSIGMFGMFLMVAFFAAVLWTLFYYRLLSFDQTQLLTYIALVLLATIMAVGLSWSHVRRQLTGQIDTDVVDE